MPYTNFEKTVNGEEKYCMRAIRTGRTYCYNSKEAREKGKKMHEAFAHGFKPTAKRSKRYI